MRSEPSILRDFTVDRRVWLLSGVAIGIGACATVLAVLLLRCIALFTNLFYYHRLSTVGVSPAGSPLRLLDGNRARIRRCTGGIDGTLWLRQDPWARNS